LTLLLHRGWVVALLGLVVAISLVGVGWFDYVSARREFRTLVEAQALSLRDTVAAAARANRAAAVAAEAELSERLLDNARLLVELDRRAPLTSSLLAGIAERTGLFRIAVHGADGTREHFVAPESDGPGRGQGGPGWYSGPGAGAGPGVSRIIDDIVHGGRTEVVTDLHAGRRAGVARLAVGVRRQNGGAIVVTVDAADVMDLQRQASLASTTSSAIRTMSPTSCSIMATCVGAPGSRQPMSGRPIRPAPSHRRRSGRSSRRAGGCSR
jgi:hypothetical protein